MDTNCDVRLFNLKEKKNPPELQKQNLDREKMYLPL